MAASPGTVARMMPLAGPKWTCERCFPQSASRHLSSITATTPFIPPEWGKDVADRIPGAKYVELPGRNM